MGIYADQFSEGLHRGLVIRWGIVTFRSDWGLHMGAGSLLGFGSTISSAVRLDCSIGDDSKTENRNYGLRRSLCAVLSMRALAGIHGLRGRVQAM